MLSCHPDNLIPCSADPNSVSHKGSKLPLDPNNAQDQALAWFHPRWRPAHGKFHLSFPHGPAPKPRVQFDAIDVLDQGRLENMAQMFGLCDFWGGFLDDEVQHVANDVCGWLAAESVQPNEPNVRAVVLRLAQQQKNRIGRDALAIVKSYFFKHVAETPSLLAQVVRSCAQGT